MVKTATNGNGASVATTETPSEEFVPSAGAIQLQRLEWNILRVHVVGTAPLIVNKFSEKAKEMMGSKQQGRATVREAKNPEQCFQDAQHRLDDGRHGVSAPGFKGAMASASRFYQGITIVGVKQMLFVRGTANKDGDQLVAIEADPPRMFESPVRNASGVADLRYRPMYWPWSAWLDVEFMPSQIAADSLVALIDASGRCGVGEWRPTAPKSTTGMYGTYRIDDDTKMEIIKL